MTMPDLKEQYEMFMKRMNLEPNKIPREQYIMMEDAFMGACSVILVLLKEAPESEDEGVQLLESLWQQSLEFWGKKSARKN